jgi:hypothetical protein
MRNTLFSVWVVANTISLKRCDGDYELKVNRLYRHSDPILLGILKIILAFFSLLAKCCFTAWFPSNNLNYLIKAVSRLPHWAHLLYASSPVMKLL